MAAIRVASFLAVVISPGFTEEMRKQAGWSENDMKSEINIISWVVKDVNLSRGHCVWSEGTRRKLNIYATSESR